MRSRTSILALLLFVAGVGLLMVSAVGTAAVGPVAASPTDISAAGPIDATPQTAGPIATRPAATSSTGNQSTALGTGVQTTESVVEPCAADPPDDYADPPGNTEDVIGWVEGYWYNEPLQIDTSEELTEEELTNLTRRTAARFEAMRCLPVTDGVPPVEIVTRAEFRAQSGGDSTDAALTDWELFDNTKLQTLLMVSEDEDSSDVRDEQRGEIVAGYYDYIQKEIVIVSDDPDSLLIDEPILAHEIGHAIQDQHFDLGQYRASTVDADNANLGLIEGDVHLIEHRYLAACEQDQWAEPCVTIDRDSPDSDAEAGGGEDATMPNWGLYFKQFQPYSDGPSFVEYIYEERGGWEGVNALYENPPQSAIEVAHPEKYGEFEPADVAVPDRSGEDWDRLTPAGTNANQAYDTLGISGIAAMFAHPTLEGVPEGQRVFAFEELVNLDEANQVDPLNPHNYDHPETQGWRDDKLSVYRNADNETASVWRLAWESEADARPFVESYGQLVEVRGGERVDGFAYTYEFDDATYDMAVTVVPEGEEVTIVTAPDVDGLTDVHEDITLIEADDTNDTAGETGDDVDTTDDTEDTTDTVDDDGTGFGGVAVAGALVVLALLGLCRR